ncbi:MAG TPA: hypothetical protein PLS69_06175 [Terricaulis sp.]|nr:hypothetical protein [Terricaulis sp.]
MTYRELDPAKLQQTLDLLQQRIDARFPSAGLSRLCRDLIATAQAVTQEAHKLAQPNWPLRVGVSAIIIAGAIAQIAAFKLLRLENVENNIGLLGNLEAAVNLLILFGGAVWFLLTLEERTKRQRALDELHKLRSIAHVIDMHQLTKDPAALLQERAPPRRMTKFELTRYLDYCSEMLALIGKLAALYADPVVIDAVTEIENLTTSLARKIWQKISVIGEIEEGAA